MMLCWMMSMIMMVNDGADGAGCHRHSMRLSPNQGSLFRVPPRTLHLGCSLNSLKGAIQGSIIGVIEGHTWSLD